MLKFFSRAVIIALKLLTEARFFAFAVPVSKGLREDEFSIGLGREEGWESTHSEAR
jgi:hypothetical protein